MRAALVLIFACLTGCTGSQTSERCQDACRRDAECVEEQEEDEPVAKFDRDECEATCAILERDSKGKELVRAHAECVTRAADCDAVRACP